MVPVCAAVEADIAELDDDERDEFIAELGLEGAGAEPRYSRRLSPAEPPDCFTAGVKEVRAWTIPVGNRAAGRF